MRQLDQSLSMSTTTQDDTRRFQVGDHTKITTGTIDAARKEGADCFEVK